MVLFSFSINSHIDLIKQGLKNQTTRIPRKLRSNGEPAYKVGDKVQLYDRSRQSPSCKNCISLCPNKLAKETEANHSPDNCLKITLCSSHTNFFGESEIIDIIHYHHGDYKERYHEIWTGYPLALAGKEDQESWAIADGFSSWQAANFWFNNSTGNPHWADHNLDVIVWNKEPIIKRWNNGNI